VNHYRSLSNQIYSRGEYALVPIRFEDRYDIMRWRNEQIYHLRQNKPLTKKDQDLYFDQTVSNLFEQEKPSQLLFSFLKNDKCIGYGGLVHVNWVDKHAEISFIMDTKLENESFEKYWNQYLDLIEKVAFTDLLLHKIFTYAFDLRSNVFSVLEKNKYLKEAVLKDHKFFNGGYVDVLIHSKMNSPIKISQ